MAAIDAVDGDEKYAPAAMLKSFGRRENAEFREESGIAGGDVMAFDCAGNAFAGDGSNIGGFVEREFRVGSAFENGFGQRMFGSLFKGGCHEQELWFGGSRRPDARWQSVVCPG